MDIEESIELIEDGYRLRIKEKNGKRYNILRSGYEERSLGPYTDERYELWSIVCKLVEDFRSSVDLILKLMNRIDMLEKKDQCIGYRPR